MELLIVGGIALLGYNLSEPGRGPRQPPRSKRRSRAPPLTATGRTTQYPAPRSDLADLRADHIAAAQRRWEEARDPALTGVVRPDIKLTNAVLPFFTSARKQNTNEAVKQTRLEMFTGANGMGDSATGTYRHKREVEAMFPPAMAAGRVTSAGTMGNAMVERDHDRFQPSALHNNVLPSEKIFVGRGVGVGPDVAATDGFHPMYRVLTKNVGEYKKNNLPGSFNHGGAGVSKTSGQGPVPEVAVNKNPDALLFDQERRPMMPSMAAVHAPTEHAQQTFTTKRTRVTVDDHYGHPGAGAAGLKVRSFRETRIGYDCGDNPDRNMVFAPINATSGASVSGTGGYSAYSFDPSRICAQQREMPGGTGHLKGPATRQAPQSFVLPPTQRDMTSTEYVGGAGGAANAMGQALHKDDEAKTTLREGQNASTVLGPVAAIKGGMMDNVWRYRRLGREAKDVLTEARPLPSRVNVMTGPGQTALRDDESLGVAPYMASVPNKGYNEDVGRLTAPSNKLPTANPRLDLCVAKEQLKDNPYSTLW